VATLKSSRRGGAPPKRGRRGSEDSLFGAFSSKFKDQNVFLGILDTLTAAPQVVAGVTKEVIRREKGFAPVPFYTAAKRGVRERASFMEITGSPEIGLLLDVAADPLSYGAVATLPFKAAIKLSRVPAVVKAAGKVHEASEAIEIVRKTKNALGTRFAGRDFMLRKHNPDMVLDWRHKFLGDLQLNFAQGGNAIRKKIEDLVPDLEQRKILIDLLEEEPVVPQKFATGSIKDVDLFDVRPQSVPEDLALLDPGNPELIKWNNKFDAQPQNVKDAFRISRAYLDELEQIKLGSGLLTKEMAEGFLRKTGLNYVPHRLATRDFTLARLKEVEASLEAGEDLFTGTAKLDDVREWIGLVEKHPATLNTRIIDDMTRMYAAKAAPSFTRTRKGRGTATEIAKEGWMDIELDVAKVLQLEDRQVANAVSTQMYMKNLAQFMDESGLMLSPEVLKNPAHMAEALAKSGMSKKAIVKRMREGFKEIQNVDIFKGKVVPKSLADEIEKALVFYSDTRHAEGAYKLWLKLNQTYKAWTLAPFLSYHFRNMISNAWNMHLAGVSPNSGARNSARGFAALRRWKSGQFSKTEGYFGMTDEQFYKFALKNRIIRGGQMVGEIGDAVSEMSRPRNWLLREIDPSTSWVIDKGFRTGEYIEDSQRLALFMDRLQKGESAKDAARTVQKFLFDYKYGLTNFETKFFKNGLMPFYAWCVPEDTECLTNEGWKHRHELQGHEKLLGYDDGKLVWTELKEWKSFDYDGVLLTEKGKTIDIACTPNHRWYCYDQQGRPQVRQAVDMRSNFRIPIAGEFDQESSVSPEDAAKIGWIYTDGYTRVRGKHTEVMIYQKKYLGKVVGMFQPEEYTLSYHPDTDVGKVQILGGERKRLMGLCGSREELPAFVSGLSKEAAEAMYQAMMDAEGTRSATFDHFSQLPGPVLDSFQVLCLLTGRSANISSRGCYVRTSKFIKHMKWGTEWFKGKVWCPVTGTGNWFMRRNGKICVTGNTRFNIPLQLEMLARQPQKYVRIYKGKRYLEDRAGGPDPDTAVFADWLKHATTIRLRWDKKNKRHEYFMLDSWLPAADINKVFQGPRGIGQEILNLMSPLVKTIPEMVFNYNMFQGRKIEEFKGQKKKVLGVSLPAKMAFFLRSIRVFGEADRVITFAAQQGGGSVPRTTWKAVQRAIIGKTYPIDPAQQKRWWDSKTRRDLITLKRQLKRATSQKDEKMIRVLKEQITEIQKERREHLRLR